MLFSLARRTVYVAASSMLLYVWLTYRSEHSADIPFPDGEVVFEFDPAHMPEKLKHRTVLFANGVPQGQYMAIGIDDG